VAGERPARLDLSRPRAYGELLQTTIEVFVRHADVLLTLALVVVAPPTLIVDGIWGRALADGVDAKPSLTTQGVSAALSVFVVLPLVTAATALVVRDLGRGTTATGTGHALRAGAAAYPRVLGGVVLYVIGVFAGLVLLIVPGVFVAIRGYFVAQAAALDGVGPVDALRASSATVQGSWWRTFWYLLATGLIFGLFGSIAISLAGATGSGAVYVAGLAVVESIALALTSIFAVLLFHDLRARQGRRPASDAPETMAQ
jgi:hypothetical protein